MAGAMLPLLVFGGWSAVFLLLSLHSRDHLAVGIGFGRIAALCLLVVLLGVPGVFVVAVASGMAIDRAERAAEPVVTARDAYVAANGHRPIELADLVPEFLLCLPGTTLIGAPTFEYSNHSGELFVWRGSDPHVFWRAERGS
ncbi:MAG: hypothetical protein AAF726_19920 [Planctomycetota bacterium]